MLRITRQKKAHATPRRSSTASGHGFWQDLFIHQLPRTHLLAAAGVALALIITMAALPSKDAEAKRYTTDITQIQAIAETEFTLQEDQLPATKSMANNVAHSQASPEPATTDTPDSNLNWQDITVKSGDSLSTLFSRASLGARDVHKFVSSNADTNN